MSETYAPPPHPPPASSRPAALQSEQDDIPDDPPPAYTPSADPGQTRIQSGPSHVDFSGPPPIPSRLENNITGVGVGYEPRPQHTGPNGPTGFGGGAGGLPPPPIHPDRTGASHYGKGDGSSPSTPVGNMGIPSSSGSNRPPPPQDTSPTEIPTPGRPLLHRGQLLIYPKGYFCHKCGNTGYKANDPSNPHESVGPTFVLPCPTWAVNTLLV
ncbi:hypothetical protein BCR39DRAFT_20512 [Naematelia encephala]|uniref:Uncharacterized protein n=1 Tax=Naematelia encephala TaxID=71784 RepID=A0A1Y2BLB8_9TREE|nr:hypothetical protein BCR39DRAFT_20512 [Naematelia encephala]